MNLNYMRFFAQKHMRLALTSVVWCFCLATFPSYAQNEEPATWINGNLLPCDTNDTGGIKILSDALGTTVVSNETAASEDVLALARSLEYDPVLIYRYVKNKIEPGSLVFGVHNGASGCLLAGRGNEFDQAALLASLLRVSSYTTRFTYAKVNYLKQDLAKLYGISTDDNVLANLYGRGGAPSIGYSATLWQVQRLWVEVSISNTWVRLDPFFKDYVSNATNNWPAVAGFNRSMFLGGALNGATTNSSYVQNLSETNIAQTLTG